MNEKTRLEIRMCRPVNFATSKVISEYISDYGKPDKVYLIGVFIIYVYQSGDVMDTYEISMNIDKYYIREIDKDFKSLLKQEYGLKESYSLTDLRTNSDKPLVIKLNSDDFEICSYAKGPTDNLYDYITALFWYRYYNCKNTDVRGDDVIKLEYPIEIHMQDTELHDNTYGEAYKYYATSLNIRYCGETENKLESPYEIMRVQNNMLELKKKMSPLHIIK